MHLIFDFLFFFRLVFLWLQRYVGGRRLDKICAWLELSEAIGFPQDILVYFNWGLIDTLNNFVYLVL